MLNKQLKENGIFDQDWKSIQGWILYTDAIHIPDSGIHPWNGFVNPDLGRYETYWNTNDKSYKNEWNLSIDQDLNRIKEEMIKADPNNSEYIKQEL